MHPLWFKNEIPNQNLKNQLKIISCLLIIFTAASEAIKKFFKYQNFLKFYSQPLATW